MSLSAALGAVEEVLLDVVEHVEPRAARGVADGGAIRAGGALGLCDRRCASQSVLWQHEESRKRTVGDLERECESDSSDELLESHGRSTDAGEKTVSVLGRGSELGLAFIPSILPCVPPR